MYLCSVFCIFVTTFVLVKCHDGNHIKKHMDYTPFKPVDCFTHRKGVQNTVNESKCHTYPKHVALRSMPTEEFFPQVISVKRCSGHCPRHSCLPKETRKIKVPVKVKQLFGNRMEMCGIVEVEEHVHCRCLCEQRAGNCNERQYYIKSRCACACINGEKEKLECQSKMGMVWDDRDCTCNCTEMDMQCQSNLKWDRKKCSCRKISGNE